MIIHLHIISSCNNPFAEAKQEERVELVSEFPNYEEYLDSQINSEDEFYLEVCNTRVW